MTATTTTDDVRFWDRAARKYAADPIKDMAGYERTLERARELIAGSAHVLEIGCGTGSTALRLATAVGRYTATDISGEMIAIAREKAQASAVANVEFKVAAAADAIAPDQTFDAVLAFNVLHLVASRRDALRQAHRMLHPGGLLVTKTPCLAEMNLLIRLAVPLMQRIGKAPSVSFFTAAELEREFAATGFDVIERARHGSGRRDPRIYIAARRR